MAVKQRTAHGYALRAVVLSTAMVIVACTATKPPTFGVRQGQLMPCPEQRACVSSQAEKRANYIAPLRYHSSHKRARRAVLAAIRSLPKAHIVSSHRDYIRARFPGAKAENSGRDGYYYVPEAALDDLEIYLVPNARIIQIRSAARRGLLDGGENRGRAETMRKRFKKILHAAAK